MTRPAPGPHIGYSLVQPDELPLLTSLGLQAFGEEGLRRYGLRRSAYYERVHGINPNSYRFIVADTNRPASPTNVVGLLAVIATYKTVYPRFASGERSQFEFGHEDIASPHCQEPRDLFLQAMYLHPDAYRYRRRLLRATMVTLAHLSTGGLQPRGTEDVRLYCEAVSPMGLSLMHGFDMRPDGRSRDGNPVYLLETPRGQPFPISTPYKRLNGELIQLQVDAMPRSDRQVG